MDKAEVVHNTVSYMDQFVGAFISIVTASLVFVITKYFENKKLSEDNKVKKLEELLSLIMKSKHGFDYYTSEDELAKIKVLIDVYLVDKIVLNKFIEYLELKQSKDTASTQRSIKDKDYNLILNTIKNEMNI